jgi:SAM-dependent methyltransferase
VRPSDAATEIGVTFDPEAVRAFEHAGWQRAASGYLDSFAHATRPFAYSLLDAARVGPGTQMLDLACGSGIALAAARERGAISTGLDFSAAMIAVARPANPGMGFVEADAEALPFAEASFDAVVSNFGLHHVPDPLRATSEAGRVLRPGGRVAFTTWAGPADNIAWKILFDAISAHGDLDAAKTPPSGGGLVSPEDLLRVLDAAGFTACQARPVRSEWCVTEAAGLLQGFRRGTVRTAALIAAQPPEVLPAIERAMAQSLAPYRRREGFAVPITAILGSAARP